MDFFPIQSLIVRVEQKLVRAGIFPRGFSGREDPRTPAKDRLLSNPQRAPLQNLGACLPEP